VLNFLGLKQLMHERDFPTTFSVYPSSIGPVRYSLRIGKGEGDEEEEWYPTSVTPLLVQCGFLKAAVRCIGRPIALGSDARDGRPTPLK